MTITYTNKITGERTKREDIKDFSEAWSKADEVCEEMNWNPEMFSEDVLVRELK